MQTSWKPGNFGGNIIALPSGNAFSAYLFGSYESWWFIPRPTNRKWIITLVTSGVMLLVPFITRLKLITYLLSGMNHQVDIYGALMEHTTNNMGITSNIRFTGIHTKRPLIDREIVMTNDYHH